jgi:catechol 2,3-dioxygenase-like lactoylglutathione lyase family enzyme
MSLASSIHHVAVIVADVEKATAFYRAVFEFPDRERLTARVSSNRGAWFQVGSMELHLQERPGETPKSEQHFALMTEHFEEIQKRALANGGGVEEAKLIEGIKKRCFIRDIDGNRIELLSR